MCAFLHGKAHGVRGTKLRRKSGTWGTPSICLKSLPKTARAAISIAHSLFFRFNANPVVNWKEFFLYPIWGLFKKLSMVDTEKASFL